VVAAAMLPVPWNIVAMKLRFNGLANAYELFSYPVYRLDSHFNKIKENPDQLKRAIEAGLKANHYIRTQREGTVQFMEERLKIDRETALETSCPKY
jgi:hypothetical protein